jgi:hypothetical protein
MSKKFREAAQLGVIVYYSDLSVSYRISKPSFLELCSYLTPHLLLFSNPAVHLTCQSVIRWIYIQAYAVVATSNTYWRMSFCDFSSSHKPSIIYVKLITFETVKRHLLKN